MDNKDNIAQTVAALAAAGFQTHSINGHQFVLVPAGYQLQNFDSYADTPARKKGIAALNDAASFIDYVKTHATGDTTIYGLADPASFVAVLNGHSQGKAGWGDHRASYTCPVAKEWAIWNNQSGKAMDQQKFAEFIEANLPDIVSTAPGEPAAVDMLEVSKSFKVNKSVNFASDKVLSNGRVQFTYVEDLKGTAGEKGQINVPEKFYIGIPVFEGGAPYKIEANLRWRLKDGDLAMWYELIRPHKTQEAAFLDVWKQIHEGTGVKVLRGSPVPMK